jgi:hypothetical protein
MLAGKTLDPNGTEVGRATKIVSTKIGLSKNTFERAKKWLDGMFFGEVHALES